MNEVDPSKLVVEVPISLSFAFRPRPFRYSYLLQHREAQPHTTMHSCHFRNSNESLYHSHHGLVNDLPQPGIEPRSAAWEARMLTITPPSRSASKKTDSLFRKCDFGTCPFSLQSTFGRLEWAKCVCLSLFIAAIPCQGGFSCGSHNKMIITTFIPLLIIKVSHLKTS